MKFLLLALLLFNFIVSVPDIAIVYKRNDDINLKSTSNGFKLEERVIKQPCYGKCKECAAKDCLPNKNGDCSCV